MGLIRNLIVMGGLLALSQGGFGKSGPEKDPYNTYQYHRRRVLQKDFSEPKTPWYEWWYYKVVLPERHKSFYFVYGVVNPWDRAQESTVSRAFVGVGSFSDHLNLQQNFPVREFQASPLAPYVEVGPSVGTSIVKTNVATDQRFRGQLQDAHQGVVKWDVQIHKQWAFNAMGWALGRNMTNIEWYPAQADALCSGQVVIDGTVENFTKAPCYQDRNWGSSFPDWWGWIVSNHFEGSPGSTLAIGGGRPEVLNYIRSFEGLAIGFKHKGHEYNWRSNQADHIQFDIRWGRWEVDAINLQKGWRLTVSAHARPDQFMDLQFMTPQGKLFHDFEALDGEMTLRLWRRRPGTLQWDMVEELISHHAGLEYGSFDAHPEALLIQ